MLKLAGDTAQNGGAILFEGGRRCGEGGVGKEVWKPCEPKLGGWCMQHAGVMRVLTYRPYKDPRMIRVEVFVDDSRGRRAPACG